MIEELNILLDKHRQCLKDKTVVKQIGTEWAEITTPYIDRHNDCLQIYARKDGAGYLLTDDGYTINDLLSSGCHLESPKRQNLLKTTLSGFGVKLDQGQLVVHTTPENFSLKKHSIIQAMLAVNDLFYLASPYVESLFIEDVTNWLELSDIRYTPHVKMTGKSGYDHSFDFVIPKSKQNNQPERIIQAVSNPNKGSAENLLLKWVDTKEARQTDSSLYVLLNDEVSPVSLSVIDALINYDIKPALWSQREEVREILAA